MITFVYLLACA